jgi:adenine deaminase
LVLKGGQVLSVFTGEVFKADVAVADGHVVGVGSYEGRVTHECSGQCVLPGFIDGHCHIESSKLNADEFARLILPRGTTTVIVDPHELANVLGTRGVEYILSASKDLPLGVYVMMPSCVPASPFESPAEALEACDFQELLVRPRVIGIAEMMNYPAAIGGEPDVMAKMATTGYQRVDGHAPRVTGRDLNAYIVSGPQSDHECTTVEEALEKRRLGMWVMIREASMIRNLVALLPLVQKYGTDNCLFVTDDREAGTLLGEGHINSMVRTAVAQGVSAGDAVKLASLNVARYHRLDTLGAVAPGYQADLLVVPDLDEFDPTAVFKRGRLVAERGKALPFSGPPVPDYVRGTVHVRPVSAADFHIPAPKDKNIRVVQLIPDQVVTVAGTRRVARCNGRLVADPDGDLAKLAVLERHHSSGRMGLGFVSGFGLRAGAFASTVAHDAHNLIVAGVSDEDMAACVQHLAGIGGGLVVAEGGRVLGDLPLEIAGLMSTRSGPEVAARLADLERFLRSLGMTVATPFMYLGFLALSVIPELRLTDQGLVDVTRFEIVPLGVS